MKAQYAYIDALCEAHPTLSTRFEKYRKGNTFSQQARDFGQARFAAPNGRLPANASQYAYDTFWTKMEGPYTLHRDLGGFMRDYLDDCARSYPSSYSINMLDHLDKIASNDEELTLLTNWKTWITDASAKVEAAPTMEEKQKVAEELNTQKKDMLEKVNKILSNPKATKVFNRFALTAELRDHSKMLDSLKAAPLVRDIFLSRKAYNLVDHQRTAVSPDVIDTLKQYVKDPTCIALVEKINDRYLAIENREFDKLVLKSSDNLKDLSEGEALLKKIIEPYKGKFVLLDIWGTWCGPCKEALSHSTEEYARLKDYDIEFLYLANQSPQTAWENVIKEYNVSGPNVAHYNLPKEQQDAIERHLNVHSWPTYKLFNREGQLLDLNVDARDIENIARLLDQMK
jgi:thiol-disulfide isomerase/thioredoxin